MKQHLLLFLLAMMSLCTHAQYTRLTNLPTIRIDTYDGSGITSKNHYKYCTLLYIDEKNNTTLYDSVQVRGRGNSTWGLAKKPYRLKFNHKEKFLGKGYAKAKSWTLLANAGDKTLIRNAITSAMGEYLGLDFNPAYKFVDMYLNGQYLGTYQISDQVQVRPHRVDIYEQEEVPTDTTDISGGYLLEVDRSLDFTNGQNGFYTGFYNLPINVHSPDEEIIVNRQLQYIHNYVNEFERRLHGNDFTDGSLGYRSIVDSTSLANWYVATEISANVDGFYSTYFYKERADSLLYWGPLWDYDIAYNNDNRTDRNTGGDWRNSNVTTYQLMADVAYNGSKVWVKRMWEDPWFGRLVNRRFTEAVGNGLEAYLNGVIDSLTTLLARSQELNYEKWGINKRAYHELVLYSTYDEYVKDLRQFISDHLGYLATEFPKRMAQEPAKPTPAFVPADYYYRIYNANTQHVFDVYQNRIVTNANDNGNQEQDWYFKTVGDHFQIINRSTGMALNDPTEGNVTATTGVGTQLNVAVADDSDKHQLWAITPQGYDGYYNLINAATQHAANLAGGSSAANASVLSYTSDDRNSSSTNRLWRFDQTDELPGDITRIWQVTEPADYALAYNATTGELHFGSASPEELTFTATVYNANGMKVGQFRADKHFSMQGYPAGIYIVKWFNHSRKFQK